MAKEYYAVKNIMANGKERESVKGYMIPADNPSYNTLRWANEEKIKKEILSA